MEAVLTALHLDPFTALLVIAVVALYWDNRQDRQRFERSVEKIVADQKQVTGEQQRTLERMGEAMSAVKSELALLAQVVGTFRHQ